MINTVPDERRVEAIVSELLDRAQAVGRYPTPVDDIVRAAGLSESDDYVLDDSLIEQAPEHLQALLRSGRDKILGLVDRREEIIQVAPSVTHEPRRAFIKLHEVAHHVLPWQRALVYADDRESLSPHVRRLFEREANVGAATLLFQGSQFDTDMLELPVRMDSVEVLAQIFGASFRATARRYGERHQLPIAMAAFAPTAPGRWQRLEVATSSTWQARFGAPPWPRVMDEERFPFLATLSQREPTTLPWRGRDGAAVQLIATPRPGTWTSYLLLAGA